MRRHYSFYLQRKYDKILKNNSYSEALLYTYPFSKQLFHWFKLNRDGKRNKILQNLLLKIINLKQFLCFILPGQQSRALPGPYSARDAVGRRIRSGGCPSISRRQNPPRSARPKTLIHFHPEPPFFLASGVPAMAAWPSAVARVAPPEHVLAAVPLRLRLSFSSPSLPFSAAPGDDRAAAARGTRSRGWRWRHREAPRRRACSPWAKHAAVE
jgi:hypothetical protein